VRKNKLTDRKKQAIATRKKINETALRLFSRKGFDSVTVDEICESAGVSKGGFYVYYKSKEQVILDLFDKTDEMYDAYVADELASVNDPVDRMLLLGRKALVSAVGKGVDVMQITYRARINPKKSGRPRPIESRPLYKIILAQVKEAQKHGFMRRDFTAKDVSHILLRSVDGVIHAWCLANGRFDLPAEGAKVFDALLYGLRTEPLRGRPEKSGSS
jgi:AcrR family transcriptional regulator